MCKAKTLVSFFVYLFKYYFYAEALITRRFTPHGKLSLGFRIEGSHMLFRDAVQFFLAV